MPVSLTGVGGVLPAADALAEHEADTTNVHGIPDTSILAIEDNQVGGRQLAYAQSYLAGGQQGSSTDVWADIPGAVTGTFTVGARPITVEVAAPFAYVDHADSSGGIRVYDTVNSKQRGVWYFGAGVALAIFPVAYTRTLPSLDPGTYNFKLQLQRFIGTSTHQAFISSLGDGSDPNIDQPVSIRVVEG